MPDWVFYGAFAITSANAAVLIVALIRWFRD